MIIPVSPTGGEDGALASDLHDIARGWRHRVTVRKRDNSYQTVKCTHSRTYARAHAQRYSFIHTYMDR